MKAKHLFWGLLFISLGILILMNNFSELNWDWVDLWKLWPLVFVLWGLAIIIKNNGAKVLIAGLAGIVLAVTLFASFKTIVLLTSGDFNIVFDNDAGSDYKYEITEYSEPFSDSIKTAEFHFKAGAGTFTTINDTASKLFYAHTEGVKNNYDLSSLISGGNADINMKMKKTRIIIGKHSIRNRVGMYFNPVPEWDLNFEVGAASVNLDLQSVRLRNLEVGAGAASFKAKLGGNIDQTDVRIETGVSEVEISVPENSGCEIRTDGALNSKDFSGFNKIDSDLYRTGNFSTSKSKIFIYIESGVSSIKVNRYSENW